MIRRLHARPRVDALPNQVRERRSRFGRWLYLLLLTGFFLWLADTIIGPVLRLQADGLVIAERVSVGVPFAAEVKEVLVTPGAAVRQGDVLARVGSVDLAVDLADATARIAELVAKRADIERRARIAEAVLPLARDRARQADQATDRIRDVRDNGHVSLATWSQALAERHVANERVAELQAEARTSQASLAAVDEALDDARRALAQLNAAYAHGIVTAATDGIVGLTTARPGDVLTVGQPLMLLYRPRHSVLAYLETGTLYSVAVGDEVRLSNGFVRTTGRVIEVLPVAEQLPAEFSKVFQPRDRSQVARITLPDDAVFPLFAKVELSGIGWLSQGSVIRTWLGRFTAPPPS